MALKLFTKINDRSFDHKPPEVTRQMAVKPGCNGKPASKAIDACGFNRTTICKWLNAALCPDPGIKALRSIKATCCPSTLTLTPALELQTFRWAMVAAQGRMDWISGSRHTPRFFLGKTEFLPGYGSCQDLERAWPDAGYRASRPTTIDQCIVRRKHTTGVLSLRLQKCAPCRVVCRTAETKLKCRKIPVHLVADGLPASEKLRTKELVASTSGRLTQHFLPGSAPEMNLDELAWSHAKRTGTGQRPLRNDENLHEKIEKQLAKIKATPQLVRSHFLGAYIGDWRARPSKKRHHSAWFQNQ